jgi:hypothetical protein
MMKLSRKKREPRRENISKIDEDFGEVLIQLSNCRNETVLAERNE